MAIGTYTELAQAVANWLARDDLSARVPEFIALAEAGFNRSVRCRQMEQRSTVTTVAGQDRYQWPADLLEVRRIVYLGDRERPLEFVAPGLLSDLADSGSQRHPLRWTDEQGALRVQPVPGDGDTLEIDYYAKLDISSATDSDDAAYRVLQRFPDLYLYGALMQAEPFLMNDARATTWATLMQSAKDQIDREAWNLKAGAAPMRVRTDYAGA